MSKSSSRHKVQTRQTLSLRQHNHVNGWSALTAKSSHRGIIDDSNYESHNHSRQSHERSRHRYTSRRSQVDRQSSYKQRSHHSSSNASPEFFQLKRTRRESTEKRRSSHSKPPWTKNRDANNGPLQQKEHSPLSSVISPSPLDTATNSPLKNELDSADDSFSSPPMASPPSPTSSFGNSLFNRLPSQPPTLVPSPTSVYVPELLHHLQISTSQTTTCPVLPTAFGAEIYVELPKGTEETQEEEVVPMDIASSPSVHRSPGTSPFMTLPPDITNSVQNPTATQPISTPPLQPNEQGPLYATEKKSINDTSSMSGPSAGIELSRVAKAHNQRMRVQRNKLMPVKRIPLPPLHLHLSKDGTSPLPPGWQRAPNTSNKAQDEGGYAYYYYHTRTRQTRWDPPVYPWDADPEDNLIPDRPDDDPEAPYNWDCAHRFAVTHEEIEAMYVRYRSRVLERQCMELIHEMGARTDAPQGAQEQGFAIELFTLVHNELRQFRDARVNLGRITNDEDLYYLTNKLAQEVIPKEIRLFHRAQQANASSLFAAALPEVTPAIRDRATNFVRRYMEAKGPCYRRLNHHHHHGHPNAH